MQGDRRSALRVRRLDSDVWEWVSHHPPGAVDGHLHVPDAAVVHHDRLDNHLVEAWFSLAERQAIHRGTYTSVKDLNAKIRAYIDGWNDRAHPFTWTKTADQILAGANRKKISNAEHQ